MLNPQSQLMLSHKDLATILLRENGIHEGLWEIAFELQVAIGVVGASPEQVSPGAIFGVNRVGLSKVPQHTPFSVDAAVVNPAPASTKPLKPAAKKATATKTSK